MREVYPQVAHEDYFKQGMGRCWINRMLELDTQIITDYRAWCKKRVHARECRLMRSQDLDVGARDLQAIFSQVARLLGKHEPMQMGKEDVNIDDKYLHPMNHRHWDSDIISIK